MRTIVTMAAKDIRILLRDRLGFLFTAVFPLVIALLIGVMYSDPGPDRVAAALIDEDLTPGSERFVARLKAANEIELELFPEDRALGRVRRGQIPVLIVLKPGFGAALDSPWTTTADVELTVDPSRIVEVFLVRAVLLRSVGEELSERPGEGVPDTGLPVTMDLVEVQAERDGVSKAFSRSVAQG
ncbi:MAG: hypothetical protein OXG11_11535, partial [Chloroflexi bacterium]|nr:hypothetical protein [Chloroflexota bacterium]